MPTIEDLLDAYDAGRLDRQQMVVAVTDAVRADAEAGTFHATGINHVALSVSDIGVMRDFLVEHLGAGVIREDGTRCFVAVGANHFVGLFEAEPVGYNHLCFSVAGYDADDAEQIARDAGLEVSRTEDRVFFRGPEGLIVQVASTWGDFPLPVASE